MPYTRAQVEIALVGADLLTGKRGRVCAKIPLYDAATATPGTVPALAGPITGALHSFGVYPADPTDPTDAEVALVPDAGWEQLLAFADLYLLEACLGNWDRYDSAVNTTRQDAGKLGDRLLAELKEARVVATRYGYGLTAPTFGATDLGFAASGGCL